MASTPLLRKNSSLKNYNTAGMPTNKARIDDADDMDHSRRDNSQPEAGVGISKNPEETNTESPDASADASFCANLNYMKIEVVMFLFMFSYIIRSVSSTTMIMDKACLVHLGYSEEICKNLSGHKEIKNIVEKLANNYSLGYSLIQMIPSAILACFIGSWSDKYGRKMPIILALVGNILDGCGSTICAKLFYSRIEFFFIPAIFTGVSGGIISVLLVVYSYASDTTIFRFRTIKYAILELAFGIAMSTGTLFGGYIYKYSGYVSVFLVSTAGHVLCLIWVMFVIKESRGLDSENSWSVKLRHLWSLQQVIDSFRATRKKRPNKGKEQILALIAGMSFAVLTSSSTASINYLFAHHQYDWDNTRYSTITSIFTGISIGAMMISVPLFKRLNFGDPVLGVVGSSSMLLKNIGFGLASKKEIYYIASLAGSLASFCTFAGRSRISKVSSKDDVGKIFAFLSTAESFIPILATAIISQIFNATLDFYPGLVYLILGTLQLIPVIVFVWISRLPTVNYEEMYNNPDEYDCVGQEIRNNSDATVRKNTADECLSELENY